MAALRINNKVIEYGSILYYRYTSSGKRLSSVANIRKTLKNSEPLTREHRDTQIVEIYNYDMNSWSEEAPSVV